MAEREYEEPMLGHFVEEGDDEVPPRAFLEIRPSETSDVINIAMTDPQRWRDLAMVCHVAAQSLEWLRSGGAIEDLTIYGEGLPDLLTTADLPPSFRA